MTELNVNMQNLNKAMNVLTANNTESHRRIWQHNEEQDEKIENHEKRITKIETKMDIIQKELTLQCLEQEAPMIYKALTILRHFTVPILLIKAPNFL